MILQTLLFPGNETTTNEEELYIRKTENGMSFDTYFNLFSIYKWLHYTVLRELYLTLDAVGDFSVEFFDQHGSLDTAEVNLKSRGEINLPVPYKKDSKTITYSISFNSGGCAVYSGAYITPDTFICRKIKMVLGICTFRREEALKKNLSIIKTKLLNNIDSPLSGQLEVFISDNGQTLNTMEFDNDHIFIFSNRNAGGSGGFTRCLMEALKRQESEGFTHIIFMDDDVKLEPDALVRTYALLSLMKPEYQDACISGAMLRSDLPYIQHENGAVWDGANPRTSFPGLDLRDKGKLVDNEKLVHSDYAAWWFACYPLDVVRRIGLPLPLFIHGDDVEYGIRAKSEVILLNGICVWHEPFENKRASSLAYYDIRNTLLIHALYHPDYGYAAMCKFLLRRLAPLLLRYRYKDIPLLCLGVEDFLRGIDWLKKQKPEALNEKVLGMGYQMKPVGELTRDKNVLCQVINYQKPASISQIYDSPLDKYGKKYAWTINGWIFPAKNKKIYTYPIGVWPYELYRKKRILLFDPDSKKGISVRKSYLKAAKGLVIYAKMLIHLRKSYKKVCKEYRKRFKELTTWDFWEKYLEI